MKQSGLRQIIGNTVKSVIIKEGGESGPDTQVFLVFTNGTVLEFFGQVYVAGNLTSIDEDSLMQNLRDTGGRVTRLD